MKSYIVATTLFLGCTTMLPTGASANSNFSWGGDIRLRLGNFNRIPIAKGGATLGQYQYHRSRSRIWGKTDFTPDVSIKARLVNEFWDYTDGKPAGAPSDDKEFPSEIVLDNLYIDINNLIGGKLDLRLGRQDLFYGNGKIILDGTPGDGSRTSYFNGIKARYKFKNDLSMDLFAVANNDEDWMAINSQHRSLSPNDIDESAFGLYLKSSNKQYPSEMYYVFKHENDVSSSNNDLDLHTFGARLMPKFTPSVSGNMEVAYQTGKMENNAITDMGGWLVDAKLAYQLPIAKSLKPVVDVSYYYLSGDDSSTGSNYEGWWQVFGRWSQNMEILTFSTIGENASPRNGPGWLTNLSAPSVGLNLAVTEKGSLGVRGIWLMANEDDGTGTGTDRGAYLTSSLKYSFNKRFSSQVIYEFFDPGNYYPSSAENSHFVQGQLLFKF
jgi:hypothetical protein